MNSTKFAHGHTARNVEKTKVWYTKSLKALPYWLACRRHTMSFRSLIGCFAKVSASNRENLRKTLHTMWPEDPGCFSRPHSIIIRAAPGHIPTHCQTAIIAICICLSSAMRHLGTWPAVSRVQHQQRTTPSISTDCYAISHNLHDAQK